MTSVPWAGWAFVYGVTLLFFALYRVLTLHSLITMYGSEQDATLDVEAGAVALGALQDLVCATYLSTALWLVDNWLKQRKPGDFDGEKDENVQKPLDFRNRRAQKVARMVTFVTSLLLFACMAVPFVADLLLVRIRDMRFNFDLVKMAIHESNNASAAEISSAEMNQAYVSAIMAVATATCFGAVRASSEWADLTTWSPTNAVIQTVVACVHKKVERETGISGAGKEHQLEEGETAGFLGKHGPSDKVVEVQVQEEKGVQWCGRRVRAIVIVVALVIVPGLVLMLSQAASALVAYAALNATLNELFMHALFVSSQGFVPLIANGSLESAEIYIHSATEDYELFEQDSLYR
ncbi:Hypothetical protein PHPALM_10563, partial [Phytophthora palmivora]